MSQRESQQRMRARKSAIVKEYRNSRGCARCPERHPATLDLHHREGEEKHPRMRTSYGRGYWLHLSFEDIIIELAKCDVLCANCHRKHHYEEAMAE